MGGDEDLVCGHEMSVEVKLPLWFLAQIHTNNACKVPVRPARVYLTLKSNQMGQLLSRIKLVLSAFGQLDSEYRAIKKRIDRSPGLPVSAPTLPFWSVPPASLPTSENASLPGHVDVLVIGSGITGLSCTRTLLNKGPSDLRVLVLEARDVCSGATGR